MTGGGAPCETEPPALPIFVYGTLRPGHGAFDELQLASRVDVIGPDRVAGSLHDLGDYPGALLGAEGAIIGDLLLPRDPALLSLLDEYELYDPTDPTGSEYIRRRIRTLDRDVDCWIYVYNQPIAEGSVIPGGDWSTRFSSSSSRT